MTTLDTVHEDGNEDSDGPFHWMGDLALHDICDLHRTDIFSPEKLQSRSKHDNNKDDDDVAVSVGVLLLQASWNCRHLYRANERSCLEKLTKAVTEGLDCIPFAACVQVDTTDESLDLCLGDNESSVQNLPSPPESLPVLAIVLQKSSMKHSVVRYVRIRSTKILSALRNPESDVVSSILNTTRAILDEMVSAFGLAVTNKASSEALRIFVAGDRSSVGKSSVCLGILGNLLSMGYPGSSLAYIKPATQSESTQLVELYCEKHGITCVPVGPLVYYRGFTRAFLAGETESTAELLDQVGHAVDRVARGKQIVLVDGVGFPAVGSICGTDNASVAAACGYPLDQSEGRRRPMGVLLVGGSGVGAAVDAFNLNATYFETAGVPVLGAVFNKLSTEGFYSLENCKKQVTSYFDQNADQIRLGRRPFGFVPLFPAIAGDKPMSHVEEYLRIFAAHVDVEGIVDAASRIKQSSSPDSRTKGNRPVKKRKVETLPPRRPIRNRDEIESKAISSGAAPSA